jgi:hypothetical protein
VSFRDAHLGCMRRGPFLLNPSPFAIYDTSISYPSKGDSIPAWVSVLFLFILTSLFVGECVLFTEVRAST